MFPGFVGRTSSLAQSQGFVGIEVWAVGRRPPALQVRGGQMLQIASSVGWPIVPNHPEVHLFFQLVYRWISASAVGFSRSLTPQSANLLTARWPPGLGVHQARFSSVGWPIRPWLSRHPLPIVHHAGFQIRHRPESGLRLRRRFWPHSLGPPGIWRYWRTKAFRAHLGQEALGPLPRTPTDGGSSSNPSAPGQSSALRNCLLPNSSSDNSTPASPGGLLHPDFSWFC